MKLSERIHTLLPASVSPLEYAKAKVVTTTSIGIGFAIFALVLYWILTSTPEQIETIFVTMGLILLFAWIVGLVKKGYINTGGMDNNWFNAFSKSFKHVVVWQRKFRVCWLHYCGPAGSI